LAATSVPSLVLARGHRIENVSEIPFVISNTSIDGISKTRDAVEFLEKIEAFDEIEKVKESRKIRKGKGKARNRRHVQRKGPLIVYQNEDTKVSQAFRNIPGIELCHVSRLNLLQLAPGGHLGRFVIWTEDAFKSLDNIYGTFKNESTQKKGWTLPTAKMTNSDLARIINSDEIQSAIRPKQTQRRFSTRKKNPLKNLGAMVKLNPYALTQRRRIILASERSSNKRRAQVQKKRAGKRFLEEILFAPQAAFVEKESHKEEVFEGYQVEDVSVSSEEEEVVVKPVTEGDEKEEDKDE
jgi:large subunit ribosomal protein L4e